MLFILGVLNKGIDKNLQVEAEGPRTNKNGGTHVHGAHDPTREVRSACSSPSCPGGAIICRIKDGPCNRGSSANLPRSSKQVQCFVRPLQ